MIGFRWIMEKKFYRKLLIYKLFKKVYLDRQTQEYKLDHDPEKFIKEQYKKKMGRELKLDDPATYTEKIQWRMLYGEDPLYITCTDKIAVRDWISDLKKSGSLDDLKCPEWYGVYYSAEELDLDELPDTFVLKSSHGSAQIIICTDKSRLDKDEVRDVLDGWIKKNHFYVAGEKQYRDIRPGIIAEELLSGDIVDYKIFCFMGKPYISKVTKQNKKSGKSIEANTYYNDWTPVEFKWKATDVPTDFEKPGNWERMLEIAEILAAPFNFVRVDLYSIGNSIYFSEMTFTPNHGCEPELPYETDLRLGKMFDRG